MHEEMKLECLKLAFSINPVTSAAEVVEDAKILLEFIISPYEGRWASPNPDTRNGDLTRRPVVSGMLG